jgi:gamma-glutamyltranspeptidase/glutathione hydrolase
LADSFRFSRVKGQINMKTKPKPQAPSSALLAASESRLLNPRKATERTLKRTVAVLLVGMFGLPTALATEGSRFQSMSKVSSPNGVVASISDQASAVGIDILNRGGNTIDAAIAMVFAIGVTRPDYGGIGGAGFLVFRSGDGSTIATIEFRGKAPVAVKPDTFSGPGMHRGEEDLNGYTSGHRVPGVPGMVAGMVEAITLGSGRFTLNDLIAPAEALAHDGIDVTWELASNAFFDQVRFTYYPETAQIYGGLDEMYLS